MLTSALFFFKFLLLSWHVRACTCAETEPEGSARTPEGFWFSRPTTTTRGKNTLVSKVHYSARFALLFIVHHLSPGWDQILKEQGLFPLRLLLEIASWSVSRRWTRAEVAWYAAAAVVLHFTGRLTGSAGGLPLLLVDRGIKGRHCGVLFSFTWCEQWKLVGERVWECSYTMTLTTLFSFLITLTLLKRTAPRDSFFKLSTTLLTQWNIIPGCILQYLNHH